MNRAIKILEILSDGDADREELINETGLDEITFERFTEYIEYAGLMQVNNSFFITEEGEEFLNEDRITQEFELSISRVKMAADAVIDFENEFENFKESYGSYDSYQKALRNKKFFFAIREAEKMVDSLKEGDVITNKYAMDLIFAGQTLLLLDNVPIIRPDGSDTEESIDEVYGKKFLNDEEYWDSLYELSSARNFSDKGITLNLIDEGRQSGPDFVIGVGDLNFFVECKKLRDGPEKAIKRRKIQREIEKRTTSRIDRLDSFAVQLNGDEPVHEDIDILADGIKSVSESNTIGEQEIIRSSETGNEYILELVDYAEKEEELFAANPNIFPRKMQYEVERKNPYRVMGKVRAGIGQVWDLKEGGYFKTFTREKNGETYVINQVVDYKTGWDLRYDEWIESAVQRGRNNLSTEENTFRPGIISINVPKWILAQMKEKTVDFRGEEITQIQRLRKSIGGEFAEAAYLNAVRINTTIYSFSREFISMNLRNIHTFFNKNPEIPFPVSFYQYIQGFNPRFNYLTCEYESEEVQEAFDENDNFWDSQFRPQN